MISELNLTKTDFIIKINEQFYISDFKDGDQDSLVKYLSVKQIYDQTLAIPYPYTLKDANWWINHNLSKKNDKINITTNWAIRKFFDHEICGGIGFMDLVLDQTHKSELGYWLAEPFWNKGIMTEAVKKVTTFAFDNFKLEKVTANVFDFNLGSAKVLEKAGYQLEGILRKHYKKDGKIFDGKLYAKIKSDGYESKI